MNKTKQSATKKQKPMYSASDLLKMLGDLSATHSIRSLVALATPLGLVYNCQTHKLANIEFSLSRGEPHGFVIVRQDVNDHLYIEIMPLTKSDGVERVEAQSSLVLSASDMLEIVECGPDQDDIDEKFSDYHDYCQTCGHDKKALAA